MRHERWKEVFDRQLESTPLNIQSANPRFSLPIGEETFHWTHWLDEAELSKRFLTLSQNAILEGDALQVSDLHYEVFAELGLNQSRAYRGRSLRPCLDLMLRKTETVRLHYMDGLFWHGLRRSLVCP